MFNFLNIINKICVKNEIEITLLSRDWVIMLKKNNVTKFITGYKFDLNSHAIGEILDDKYALYDVLKKNNIPVIEHNILYSEDNKNDYAIGFNNRGKVKKFIQEHHTIVLKPNIGTCGSGVYKIKTEKELDKVLNILLNKNFSISYCPYYDIKNEYRIIVLNNEIKLIYKKIKPIVKGDGKTSIRDLLLDFNKQFFSNRLKDKKYDKVLKENEIYEYNWKFNLSGGATVSFEINSCVLKELRNITSQVLNTLTINFASIDVVEVDNKFFVLEINSGVMMENLYDIIPNKKVVEDIYEEAIISMFKNN